MFCKYSVLVPVPFHSGEDMVMVDCQPIKFSFPRLIPFANDQVELSWVFSQYLESIPGYIDWAEN